MNSKKLLLEKFVVDNEDLGRLENGQSPLCTKVLRACSVKILERVL